MDIKHKNFPFVVKAENKTSAAGNDYLSIGLGQSKKNQGGDYETIWMNFIDKRDLLVLAATITSAYSKICQAENAEFAAKSGGAPAAKPAPAPLTPEDDDDIPF